MLQIGRSLVRSQLVSLDFSLTHIPSDRTMALGSTQPLTEMSRVETESYGTRRSTGGEVKGKEANGVGSQHSCTVWEHGLSSITTADAHTSAASSRLN